MTHVWKRNVTKGRLIQNTRYFSKLELQEAAIRREYAGPKFAAYE
jgi:hypothetical protein